MKTRVDCSRVNAHSQAVTLQVARLLATPLPLTDVIFCEVLQGLRDDDAAKEVENLLLRFEVFEMGGVVLAREAARKYRTLRRRGRTVRKTIDCLIATFCIREGHSLLHRDRDFDPFEEFLELSAVHP
jgi:predicted nucleic acid-binding protein